MRSFTVPTIDQVGNEAKPAFEQFQKTMGKMPNLYATIGYSANALNAYLQYTAQQARGSFHARDREAVYLIVSQLNDCHYCLASHTQSAIRSGWKEEDTLQLRAGTFPDKKWQTIYLVIRSVIESKGEVSDTLQDDFFALGYKEAALIDLFALINVMSFTNYIYRLTKIPIDFPEAKEI
jgi:AhpD family alkylhydroperoxidase